MKPHQLITAVIVALCLCFVYGCGMFGVVTKDDLNAEHEDQRKVDHEIVDRTADVFDGKLTSTDMANEVNAVIEKSADRSRVRNAPPPVPPVPSDWQGVAALAGTALTAATMYLLHQKQTKSLAETDNWIQETEDKVHANTVTTAMTAAKVGVQPVQPTPA